MQPQGQALPAELLGLLQRTIPQVYPGPENTILPGLTSVQRRAHTSSKQGSKVSQQDIKPC